MGDGGIQIDAAQRGTGRAMAAARFRDPVGLEDQIASLQLEIARILVNAPALPVDLPRFDLTLRSVAATRHSIDLILGKSAILARLQLRRGGDKDAAIDVTLIEEHPDAQRFEASLNVIAQRLRAAVTSEKWQRASAAAQHLAALPVGVPLAFYRQLVPGMDQQALVRTGFNCNQDCGICWQDRDWGRHPPEQIVVWIEDLYAAGARQLIISGGEPTLDRQLDTYIRRARELGFRIVTLETNAVQFAKPGLAERLRDAGLTDCFVSLHSGDAATSDAITRAPGTFVRTVAGIRALLAARVPVRLNCVMTREGIEHLRDLPEFVHSTFGSDANLRGLMLSQPTDPYDPALLRQIVPHPQRLRTELRAALDRAFDLGIPISGLDGPCGPPLCAFAADRRITDLAPIPELLQGRTYVAGCDRCAVRSACFGVRSADVELYGEACVSPLAAVPARPSN